MRRIVTAGPCISPPWLTSLDTNGRGRPGGRPRKMRLSRGVTPATCGAQIDSAACPSPRWPQLIQRAGFAPRARRRLSVWAALCAAHSQVPISRSEQEPWRERPRRARLQWPRACPEGSLTPWLSVSMSIVRNVGACRAESAGESALTCARRSGPDRPDDLARLVPEDLASSIATRRADPIHGQCGRDFSQAS